MTFTYKTEKEFQADEDARCEAQGLCERINDIFEQAEEDLMKAGKRAKDLGAQCHHPDLKSAILGIADMDITGAEMQQIEIEKVEIFDVPIDEFAGQ